MNTEAYERQLEGTPMAPIMSISRLRLGLDGDGVTETLADVVHGKE
jgi:hypothetical protein